MTNKNTANLINRCLGNKMTVKEHFSTVFGIVKFNLLDILILAVLFNLLPVLMFISGFGGFLAALVYTISTAMLMSSVTILIDAKSRNEVIDWKEAIIRAIKKPFLAIGAVLIQQLIMSFIGGFLGVLVGSFVILNVQFAVLRGLDMFSSTKESFSLVSKNLVDVLLKNILLNFVMSLPMAVIVFVVSLMGIKTMNAAGQGTILFLSSIISTVTVVSAVVFYYNLTSKENKA